MERTNEEQPQFEAICAQVEDFEPLPTIRAPAIDPGHEQSEEQQREPLDGLILAGLVSP